jgi:hypothetical protein
MNKRHVIIMICAFLCLMLISLSCSASWLQKYKYRGPCQIPQSLEIGNIFGTWKAVYADYINPHVDFVPGTERIDGTEQLVINENGTYIQSFISDDFVYVSHENKWELVTNVSEGPKLIMYGFRYFPHGLKLADGPLELSPQTVDLIRYQEMRNKTGIKTEKLIVSYPEDGFVFLYPRNCFGDLTLLPMVADQGDPDALAVHNPPFEKIDEE